MRRRLAGQLTGALVSVAAMWLALRSVDATQALSAVASADPLPLAACLAVIAAQVVLRTVRWRMLLPRREDGTRVSRRRLLPVLLVGYLGNAVLPARLGEPIRAYLVASRESLRASETFGTVVLERVVDTATLAIVAFVAAAAIGAPSWVTQATGLVATVAGGVVLFLATAAPNRLALLARRFGRGRLRALSARFESFATGVGGSSRRMIVLSAAFISAICWLLDAMTFWLVGRSLGIELLPAGALLLAAVTVLGTAAPSAPGYVGTFELAAAAMAGALGVEPASAFALAILAHVIVVVPIALAGTAALALMGGKLPRLALSSEQSVADVAASPMPGH